MSSSHHSRDGEFTLQERGHAVLDRHDVRRAALEERDVDAVVNTVGRDVVCCTNGQDIAHTYVLAVTCQTCTRRQ